MNFKSFESLDELIKQAQDFDDREMKTHPVRERRFRGSIYVDIFVEESDDKENDRERVLNQLEYIVSHIDHIPELDDNGTRIGQAYVGGAGMHTGDITSPFDKDF
jgi:hypothetical protein